MDDSNSGVRNKSEGGMPSVAWAASPTDFTLSFVSRVATDHDLIATSLWLRRHVVIYTHFEKSASEKVCDFFMKHK